MKINIDSIIIDPGLQRRVSINKQVVEDYAEAYKAGVAFDDVIVYRVEDKLYLVDGFHRVEGATLAGKKNIDASERAGTYRQAWIYSLGVNAHHGLQRSREDKRNAVQDALADEEIGKWSNMKIAEVCAVSASLVDKVKHEAVTSHMGSEEVTYTTKHGTKAKMKTANIGQPKASAQKPVTAGKGSGTAAPASDALAPERPFSDADNNGMSDAEAAEAEAYIEQERALLAQVLAGDDALAVVTQKCMALSKVNAVLKVRITGLQNELLAMTRSAKSWMRKAKANGHDRATV